MSSHDLIFSNRPAYRISRHAMFWSFWLVFGYSITWLPNNSKEFMPFFSNWNWDELLQRIYKQRGGWFNSFYEPFRNYWLKYFLGHIVFTYTILYLVLPGYFSGKKNKIFLTIITLLLLAAYITWHYINTSINFADMVKQGFYEPLFNSYVFRPIMPDHSYILAITAKMTLFELPIVAGLAITIKLLKRWWLKQKEAEQLASGKARAELQLLKAQIHPHFLFNTLNNIYFFTISASRQAPEMIKKLSDMLRYILNECDRPAVPLEKELKLIQDYMALEKIRYGEQMDMTVELKGNYHNKMVSPLLLIPFVENSFKHGASKMLAHPYVKLTINIEDNHLLFLLTNNKPDMATPAPRNGAIGLKNVRKRLQLLYPGTHELSIVNEPGSFIVFLKIKLQEMKPLTDVPEEMQMKRHEMA
jgi:hypothetical protein